MPKALVGIILMLMVATGSGSTPVPRNAIALAPYASNRQITTGVTRLRVTVATDAAQGERAVRVGDILICKATECFWARTAGYVDVENTSTGAASVLADVLFPMNTITDVYFTAMTGRAVIEGHLQLAEPVVIEEDFPGIELFIGVRKQHAAR